MMMGTRAVDANVTSVAADFVYIIPSLVAVCDRNITVIK